MQYQRHATDQPAVAAMAGSLLRAYCVSRIRISSPVAGALIFVPPSAFLMAMNTEIESSNGGSPTALLDRMFSGFSTSIQSTLKISGTSPMFGILYVVGECERRFPFASQRNSSFVSHPIP